jgi:hypothetical protein
MAELFWLNEVQWAAIEPLLPHLGGKREPNSTFPDAGVTAMLGCMIEMDGWGDGRGVVRGS